MDELILTDNEAGGQVLSTRQKQHVRLRRPTKRRVKNALKKACDAVLAHFLADRQPPWCFLTRALATETKMMSMFFYVESENHWQFVAELQSQSAVMELNSLVQHELRKSLRADIAISTKESAKKLLESLKEQMYARNPRPVVPEIHVAKMFANAARTFAFHDCYVQFKRHDGSFVLEQRQYPALDTMILPSDVLRLDSTDCKECDAQPLRDLLEQLLSKEGLVVLLEWLCIALCGAKQQSPLIICSPMRDTGKTIIAIRLWRMVLGKFRVPDVQPEMLTCAFTAKAASTEPKILFARQCGRGFVLMVDEAPAGAFEDFAALKLLQGSGSSLAFKHSRECVNTEQVFSIGCTTNEHPMDILGKSASTMDAQCTLCLEVQENKATATQLDAFLKSQNAQQCVLAMLLDYARKREQSHVKNEYVAQCKNAVLLAAFTARRPVHVWHAERRTHDDSKTYSDVYPTKGAESDEVAKVVAFTAIEPPRLVKAEGKMTKRAEIYKAAGVNTQVAVARIGERLGCATDALMLRLYGARRGATKDPTYVGVELMDG